MNLKISFWLLCSILLLGCKEEKKIKKESLELNADIQMQYDTLSEKIAPYIYSKRPMPRTIKDGELVRVGPYDWTSGFYPGSLWNLYGLTGQDRWKERAISYTKKLDTIQHWQNNHDVGFIIENSYGNALKYMNSKQYEKVIVATAKSLATRFKPKAGVLQSWEWNKEWECPVIIDNMMNLELMFHATKISEDSTYYKIAVSHANATMKNHFRDDGSSYHVVDYDTITGKVNKKQTHQGLNDESAWARGQAWGLYGYTMSYRETKDSKYLEHANRIARFIINNSNMPEDNIPYWDFDAPAKKSTPRDASAAAIMASGLYELSEYVSSERQNEYYDLANNIMESLSSDKYLAKVGSNEGFLLKHSVGNKPGNVEVNEPLNYADYYFLEALLRKKELEKEKL